ncbi:MAG: hypothetical protein ACKOAS_02530, partial [Verrucomicrobiota bacterium]
YMRHGLGPNQIDLLFNGAKNLTTRTDDSYYYGLTNSQGGEIFAVRGGSSRLLTGNLPGAGYRSRELPLIEQVEIENTAPVFTTSLAFSQPSATDLDADGLPNAAESSFGGNFENPDTDGDGMTDGYEALYHLTVDSNDAAVDSDSDGHSNLVEFVAGTDPKDAASHLKVSSSAFNPATREITLNWPSVPGRVYRIEHKSGLGDSTWTEVATYSATAASSSKSISAPANSARGFYRITTRP